jgi:predicted alpha-1,2-mannosidase
MFQTRFFFTATRLLLLAAAPLAIAGEGQDYAALVNPLIGTGDGAPDYSLGNAAGNTPPGAAFPFGMVLWSPDTTVESGGYRYDQDRIQGFSLTHFSGRGISCYQDIPIMPVAGAVTVSPGDHWTDYSAGFNHANEQVAAGSYSVKLNNGIGVDLAVTQRTGFGRFAFPAGLGTFLVNAGGSAQGNRDAGTAIRISGPRNITGSATSGDCGGWFTYQVFFALEFDRPFVDSGTWSGATLTEDGKKAAGASSGAYVTFDTAAGGTVQVKVGLSYVGVENAMLNLRAENAGWDFAAVKDAARQVWNQRLSAIQVSGGTADQRTIFYTALYHAFIHPSTFSDANGDYLGFDGAVHSANGRTQYHNFAGWDIYRSQLPLLAMLAPETGDMIQSLVNDAAQDPGGGLPRWEHANTNSGGMLGDSQDAVISTAYAFGVRGFDTAAALAAMDRGGSRIGTTSGGALVRPGLQDYLTLGYVSTADPDSGSRTLEYAVDDFCIAQFAAALGDTEKAAIYMRRSQNWKHLFKDGYLVPRNPDGSFSPNVDPSSGLDYVEGSVAQYSWMVPFNMRKLISMMGGNAAAIRRLDEHLAHLNGGPWSQYAFMGNEPSLKTPWAYNFTGAPWKTQETVRRIVNVLFHNTPGGLPCNDDLGTLSAWYVFAATGIYPHVPGA